MQPYAALRRARAELRDRGRTVDGVVPTVENRERHRRVAKNGRTVIARQQLRTIGTARRIAEAGGHRPRIAVFAVDHDEHALLRFIHSHHDLGARGTGRKYASRKHYSGNNGRYSK